MRPVHLADVEMAARVLMRVRSDVRPTVINDMIAQTEEADRYRQATGVPHPQFGVGTLMSCAGRMKPAARPAELALDQLDAYAAVITALMAHSSHQKS